MNEKTVLFDLLKEGVSPVHVVKACEKRLADAGFEKIAYEEEWNLKAGGRYYVDHHDTTLFAFSIPADEMKKKKSLQSGSQRHIRIFHVLELNRHVML